MIQPDHVVIGVDIARTTNVAVAQFADVRGLAPGQFRASPPRQNHPVFDCSLSGLKMYTITPALTDAEKRQDERSIPAVEDCAVIQEETFGSLAGSCPGHIGHPQDEHLQEGFSKFLP
ncbi:MAG: hypothetical protein AAFV53_04905 [Myxococcota bacterium]